MKHLNTFEKFIFNKNKTVVPSVSKDIKLKDKGDNVKTLQTNLVALGFELPKYGVDGIIYDETMGAVIQLSKMINKIPTLKNKYPDFNIVNNTITVEQQELIQQMVNDDLVKKEVEKYYNEFYDKIKNNELIADKYIIKNIENPELFINKLIDISKKLKIDPNWLLLVMFKESKLNPKAVNKLTKATGLIQFMPKSAKGLGTTVEDLYKMDAIEQLDYVYKYFQRFTGKINSVQDLYLVTFFPIALGKDDNNILQNKYISAENIAKANSVVDLNKDNKITNGEFKEYVLKGIPKEWSDKVKNNFEYV